METRTALIAIIVKNNEYVNSVNTLLHDNSSFELVVSFLSLYKTIFLRDKITQLFTKGGI